MKCLNAVSPSPPTPHTMYCSSLSGSRGKSHLSSAVNKVDKQWRSQRGREKVRERGREKVRERGREKEM